MFQKATKKKAKLRLAFIGPAGTGKTYSALAVARGLVGPDGKIAVMDTEHGSASKYASEFEFDVVEPETFSPQVYIDTIRAAEEAGYDALIIDSLSHAWMGKDGALEMVDAAAARNRGNSFAGWRDVTPLHNRMIDAMLACRLHLIVTMRSKTEWVVEENEKGKKVPRKIGLQPVQRDGLEYEMDVVGDLDQENRYVISKTRCVPLAGKVFAKPGEELAGIIAAWLTDGVDAPEPETAAKKERATPGQVDEIRTLLTAPLITEEERDRFNRTLSKGISPKRAEEALEWLSKTLAERDTESEEAA